MSTSCRRNVLVAHATGGGLHRHRCPNLPRARWCRWRILGCQPRGRPDSAPGWLASLDLQMATAEANMCAHQGENQAAVLAGSSQGSPPPAWCRTASRPPPPQVSGMGRPASRNARPRPQSATEFSAGIPLASAWRQALAGKPGHGFHPLALSGLTSNSIEAMSGGV